MGSNPAGITILPARFDSLPSKGNCEAGRIFLFQDTTKHKNLLTEDGPLLADFKFFSPISNRPSRMPLLGRLILSDGRAKFSGRWEQHFHGIIIDTCNCEYFEFSEENNGSTPELVET